MLPATVIVLLVSCGTLAAADYWQDRASLMKKDRNMAVGSSLVLNTKEEAANEILMGYKWMEYDKGFVSPGDFLPAQHFFKCKASVERSEVNSFVYQTLLSKPTLFINVAK